MYQFRNVRINESRKVAREVSEDLAKPSRETRSRKLARDHVLKALREEMESRRWN